MNDQRPITQIVQAETPEELEDKINQLERKLVGSPWANRRFGGGTARLANRRRDVAS